MVKHRKTRKRKSRKKRGGLRCRSFNNDCNSCINNNNPQCKFNSFTKECARSRWYRTAINDWSRTCDPGQHHPSPETKRPGSNVETKVPLTEEMKKIHKENKKRRYQLFKRNGIINQGKHWGTPCFTRCEKKGWCEAGITGACDRNNYCYPSNKSGDAQIVDDGKQYCEEADNTLLRVIDKYDGNHWRVEGGDRKKKSRRRKRRTRRRRKSKRRRKSRRRKSRRRTRRRRKGGELGGLTSKDVVNYNKKKMSQPKKMISDAMAANLKRREHKKESKRLGVADFITIG